MGLLQLLACTKTVDTTTNDSLSLQTSNDLQFPTSNEFGNCKLRRIYHDGTGPNGLVSGVFTYNKAGNPVSLIYNNVATGTQNYYFYYDKLGRLKEYRTRYSENDPMEEERHVYGYDANNRIVTDTIGGVTGGVIFISTLTYDNLGRIVKENIRHISTGIVRNPTYTYDNRGNLAVAGWKSSSYDNKVSIFRSNPVFQFIFRNYSRNNAAPQAKYNSKGLPLSMKPGNDAFFNSRMEIPMAFYDCQ
jgi:hypothetical protein